jgi:hypothetical protein
VKEKDRGRKEGKFKYKGEMKEYEAKKVRKGKRGALGVHFGVWYPSQDRGKIKF